MLVVLHGTIHPKTFEATDIYPKQSGGNRRRLAQDTGNGKFVNTIVKNGNYLFSVHKLTSRYLKIELDVVYDNCTFQPTHLMHFQGVLCL